MEQKVTENSEGLFNYSLGKHQLTYEDGWLTLRKGDYFHRVITGPISLIETGLHLSNVASSREAVCGGYTHIDGVFHISAESGYIHFLEGNVVATLIKISDSKLLDLGLTLIELGNQLSKDDSKASKFESQVAFTSLEKC
jgi:hypothetical protein